MQNKRVEKRNFLGHICNIYGMTKSFFDRIEKTKYFPLFIIAGLRQEKTIRPTCFSFHSIGRADCANRPLSHNAAFSRFCVPDGEKSEVRF